VQVPDLVDNVGGGCGCRAGDGEVDEPAVLLDGTKGKVAGPAVFTGQAVRKAEAGVRVIKVKGSKAVPEICVGLHAVFPVLFHLP
jgi:hypothetical protein